MVAHSLNSRALCFWQRGRGVSDWERYLCETGRVTSNLGSSDQIARPSITESITMQHSLQVQGFRSENDIRHVSLFSYQWQSDKKLRLVTRTGNKEKLARESSSTTRSGTEWTNADCDQMDGNGAKPRIGSLVWWWADPRYSTHKKVVLPTTSFCLINLVNNS